MSKFLKFIVHLVIFLTIVDILALAVPPFLGITTAIVDSTDGIGNLPLGSVTYAESVDVGALEVGDSILVQDGEGDFRYRINSIDTANSVYNVYDQTDVEAGEQSITLRNTAQKVIITIGVIGYLIIAVQSTEGLIILGLVILFLIILFVLSELWRKDKRKDMVGELEGEAALGSVPEADNIEDEDAPAKTKRQLKKEAKLRAKEEKQREKIREKQELEEATAELKAEAKARKKAEKEKRKRAKKMARTGGFIEDYEPIEVTGAVQEPMNVAEQPKVAPNQQEDVLADDANEELRKEVAAATAQMTEIPDMGETREVVLPKAEPKDLAPEPIEEVVVEEPMPLEDAVVEEPVEVVIRKMAIPVYSEEELLAKARSAGEEPKVLKDPTVGVTLLDYSDIIIEGTPQKSAEE